MNTLTPNPAAQTAEGNAQESFEGRHFLHAFASFNAGGVPIRISNVLNHLGPAVRHTIVAMDGGFAARPHLSPDLNCDLVPVTAEGNLLRTLSLLRAKLRESSPDLLLTYNWGAIEWALANSLGKGYPHLHFESGFGPEEADGQLTRRVWMRRMALRRMFALVVPSHTLEDLATQVWRIDRRKVHLIPNGVDCARFARPPVVGAVPGFAKAANELIIGTVAPLRPEKNLARLIQAFAAVANGHKARLLIVGDGGERGKLTALAESLGLAERVIFAGHVERVEEVLGWFDVFAMSSDTEQMPNSLIQAMAAGLPVAATDVGDVQRIVAEENAPFIVPKYGESSLARALAHLLEAAPLRAQLGAANRDRARTAYAQDRMFKAYSELYGAALASG